MHKHYNFAPIARGVDTGEGGLQPLEPEKRIFTFGLLIYLLFTFPLLVLKRKIVSIVHIQHIISFINMIYIINWHLSSLS